MRVRPGRPWPAHLRRCYRPAAHRSFRGSQLREQLEARSRDREGLGLAPLWGRRVAEVLERAVRARKGS